MRASRRAFSVSLTLAGDHEEGAVARGVKLMLASHGTLGG